MFDFVRMVALGLLGFALPGGSLAGESVFLSRPPDSAAIELRAPSFAVHADGVGDDAPALQAAIDAVHAQPGHRGVLFVPPGTYRLGTTVNVWRGVRIIGYGATRPVFLLGAATPGFQGEAARAVLYFAFDPPTPEQPLREGGASGFFAALSNVDLEIAPGNPSAVGVRFHVAQHSFLAHVDFRLGDAHAGVEDVGNLMRDVRFFGGDYGILATRTAPTWPFVVLDSEFSGQRIAAIRTEEAGLTMVRARFRDVPRAIEINAERPEQLWLSDAHFERITGPAIMVSDSANPQSQINLQNVACAEVPVVLELRESGQRVTALGGVYVVQQLSHGFQRIAGGAAAEIRTTHELAVTAALPNPVPSDVASLPAVGTWVDARTLGVRGDGVTDDTVRLQQALRDHRTVFLPAGKYLLTDTLHLGADNVLVGLNPASTVLLASSVATAFGGGGPVRPRRVGGRSFPASGSTRAFCRRSAGSNGGRARRRCWTTCVSSRCIRREASGRRRKPGRCGTCRGIHCG